MRSNGNLLRGRMEKVLPPDWRVLPAAEEAEGRPGYAGRAPQLFVVVFFLQIATEFDLADSMIPFIRFVASPPWPFLFSAASFLPFSRRNYRKKIKLTSASHFNSAKPSTTGFINKKT